MNQTQDLMIESFALQAASLRIAVVTETFPPEVNGVAMTLGRIVEGLLQRGHSVQLIRPRQKLENAGASRNGIEEILSPGVPVPTYGELRFGLPSKRRLVKLWSVRRPDIVHVVTEGPLGWSAVAAARKLELPLTSSFHTNFQSYSQHYGLSLLKAPIESYLRKLHNRTQATLVPTRALMLDLQSRGYTHVKLLSRGVAAELFSPSKRSPALRRTWGAAEDDLVVLLVGRLAKEKNVGLVISAFRAIQQIKSGTRLVFVGDGPLRQALQATCPEAVFAGVQKGEDLATHYASGDLFLFPSLTETFGNVVPEALASGLALVCYGCAAAQELITSGVNGILVPADDALQFISAAVSVAGSAASLTQLRQAAAPSVAHLHWDAIYDRFVGHLTQVIESNQAGFHATSEHAPVDAVTRASASAPVPF
ncbi:MAG: glycosyltransferase family 1 protein [Rhodoferax sp.]|nr:glycosyltransferase family 1 protein [Rhodoferax sp.]